MTVKIRSIKLWKFILVMFALVPIWVFLPVLYIVNYGSKNVGYILGIIMLFLTVFLAHLISRSWTNLSVINNEVRFNETVIPIHEIHSYHINDSGIGMTALEFRLLSGKRKSLNVPTYGGNAKRMIEFTKSAFNNIKKRDAGPWTPTRDLFE